MALPSLDPVETRILGCLLEKERLTPENYPLSLNGLLAACNQTTNRDPILALDDKSVDAAVTSLREKKLATMVWAAGSRVQKFRHNLLDHFDLDRSETAVMCVLLLRGPQTPGELRARCERLHPFASLDEVQVKLDELGAGDYPLVRVLPQQPGQKERRYIQLLGSESSAATGGDDSTEARRPVSLAATAAEHPTRLDLVEQELTRVRDELQRLEGEFAAFRKQFE